MHLSSLFNFKFFFSFLRICFSIDIFLATTKLSIFLGKMKVLRRLTVIHVGSEVFGQQCNLSNCLYTQWILKQTESLTP